MCRLINFLFKDLKFCLVESYLVDFFDYTIPIFVSRDPSFKASYNKICD